jgi:predicted DNA repair protein MutK
MLGGAFLCFEGFEKLAHKFLHSRAEDQAHHAELVRAVADPQVDLVAYEKDKIKGAVRTDFILSAEIIVIALGTVAAVPLATQLSVLTTVAIAMTVGVYGLVAAIVKIDDAGLALTRGRTPVLQGLGRGLLIMAPWLMKALSVLGTAAMFLVGGGILTHGLPPVHHAIEALSAPLGEGMGLLVGVLAEGLFGVLAGGLVLAAVSLGQRLWRRGATA